MYIKSPSRNHRSKGGIKTKHILQICLLAAVCFWLIYQVKHSKEKDGNLAAETQTGSEMLKLGRKDVPRITDPGVNDKLDGEDEEDNLMEEEESKHEENEIERDQRKAEEREEEEESRREGGDDEIDEHEPEKIDGETEREGELDNKQHEEEGEEKSEDSKEGGIEEDHQDNEIELEDRDNDEGDEDAHEAQEEYYMGDDASSEVAHEVNLTLEHPNENSEMNDPEVENVTQSHDQAVPQENFALQVQGADEFNFVTESSANSTYTDELKDMDHLIKLQDSSAQHSTMLSESKDHIQSDNNSTSDKSQNSALLPSGIQISSNLTEAQNATVKGKSFDEGSNSHIELLTQTNNSQLDTDEKQSGSMTALNNTERINDTAGESLNSSEEAKFDVFEKTSNGEDSTVESNVNNENSGDGEADESQVVKQENGGNSGEFESFGSHSENESVDSDQHDDPTDDPDFLLIQAEKDSRTDLGTLPEIRAEVQSNEEAEAE